MPPAVAETLKYLTYIAKGTETVGVVAAGGIKIPLESPLNLFGAVLTGVAKKRDHNLCKKMHKKYFTDNFDGKNFHEVMMDFSFRVFANYNIQFLFTLQELKDGWQNAFKKLAEDTCKRVFDYLEEKAKTNQTPVSLTKNLLEEAFEMD